MYAKITNLICWDYFIVVSAIYNWWCRLLVEVAPRLCKEVGLFV